MKLYCKGEYHNVPMVLHFSGPGVIDVDDWRGEFLLKDAPDNFTLDLPTQTKLFESPPKDKMLKEPKAKK